MPGASVPGCHATLFNLFIARSAAQMDGARAAPLFRMRRAASVNVRVCMRVWGGGGGGGGPCAPRVRASASLAEEGSGV